MSDKVDLRLDWCSYEAAKYAVEHWHYSKRMPSGRNNFIGVWENNKFIGVIIYGHSIGPYIGHQFGLDHMSCYELRRVALTSHFSAVSKIVSISLKMVREKYKNARLIISYADPEYNHIGVIYQAMNWVYVGRSSSNVQQLINGRYRNDRNANSNYRFLSKGKRISTPKYKYLYPLDSAMRKQIEPLRKPYPKRGTGETDSAAQTNAQTGGASPTVPLLISDLVESVDIQRTTA